MEKFVDLFFGVLVTTPNVLTEVSNLATSLLPEDRFAFLGRMKNSVESIDETYCPSNTATQDTHFQRFGLTDATILNTSPDVLVLTDDFALAQLLASRGRDVINFNHIRAVQTLQ